MNPALLLPVLFGIALLVGAFTGHVAPEQLAAGTALLLVPGADRFAPLLRQLLRLGPAQPALPSRDLTTAEMRAFIEAAALAAYERYGDACGWRTVGGGQMPRWADQHERLRLCWREAARGALGLQPSVNPGELAPVGPVILPTPPSLPPAALLLLLPLLGCLAVVPRERAMVALSSKAVALCVAQPARCEALRPCSRETHESIVAWTAYSSAVAKDQDEGEPLAKALITEGGARLTCAAAGVK